MISATIEIAVSSGVRAPMSRPIGGHQPGELRGAVDRRPRQSLEPLVVGRPAAHDADVADVGGERALHGRHVELRVVGEDAHRVAGAERLTPLREHRAGPRDHHLVGHREAPAGGEDLAGVAHRHPVAENLGHLGERGGEVDGAEDPHLRRRGVGLDVDADDRRILEVLRGRLAAAVRSGARPSGPPRARPARRGRRRGRARDRRANRRPRSPGSTSSLAPRDGPSITVARATGSSARMRSRSRS